MIGEQIASYVITGVLGHGTQGTVYEARDPRQPDEVAIKVLLSRLTQDPAQVEHFFDEARAAASIRHPGVVDVYEHGRDDRGRAYLVMERLRGETLFERLRRGLIDVGEAAGILRQLAAALMAAHERVDGDGAASPIVHRDLKPENIFLVDEGTRARVVVMDFGIAKLAAGVRSAGTLSGAGAFGTPPYMSPEQCRGDSGVDHRTDIYAMGCLLHEMIAGTPPFGFGSPAELLRAHIDEEPPPLHDAGVDLPEGLDALARGMLAKNPEDRPSGCRAVIEVLDALALDEHVSAPPPTGKRAGTLPAVERAARPRSLAGGWRRRSWQRMLDTPSWIAGGSSCAIGAVLLGMSIVLGVGDSYLAAPNWSLTFVVLVPVLVMLMWRAAQQTDGALRTLASRRMIRGDAGVDALAAAADAAGRIGAWLVGLLVVLIPISIPISVAEWLARYRREPLPGAWWTESAITGCAGAVVQGLLIVVIIAFVVHSVAWAQLLHSWTTPRSPLRLRADPLSKDPRRGFEVLEEPLVLMLAAGALVQVVLYLSNGQSIAEARGRSFLEIVMPLGEGTSLFDASALLDAGTGRYSSTITLIASAMVLGFVVLAMWQVRRAVAAANQVGGLRWPLLAPSFEAAVGLLFILLGVTLFLRLGPPVLLALIVVAAWHSGREGSRQTPAPS